MHVLITGASSGIGEALAQAFARAGYDLTLIARRSSELDRVAKPLRERVKVTTIAFDLDKVNEMQSLLDRAEKAHGAIDVLVNNAGRTLVAHTHEISDAEADNVLRVNLIAPLHMTRLALGPMVTRGQGAIVNIASISALAPTPYSFHYNATKAGLGAASEALWEEARRSGVHVLTVYPGPVKTPLLVQAMSKMPKETPQTIEGTPAELAERILIALRAKRRRLVYPRPYALARMLPGLTRWAIDRFFPKIAPEDREE